MTHKGTATFIAQRASAALLLPLSVWLVWSAVRHAGASYEETRGWLSSPRNAALLGLFIVIGAVHMRIGLNEIIDDYIGAASRGLFKLLNLFACIAATAIALWPLIALALF